jgi:hypothetical protein
MMAMMAFDAESPATCGVPGITNGGGATTCCRFLVMRISALPLVTRVAELFGFSGIEVDKIQPREISKVI